MAVLITGGCGFIGSYVVRELLASQTRQNELDVVAYDVAANRNTLDIVLSDEQRSAVTVVQGSVLDPWSLTATMRNHDVEAVIHLASPLSDDVQRSPGLGVREIALGSVNLFEAALVAGVRRVVWASTQLVFGRAVDVTEAVDNDAAQAPDTLYGASKSLVERIAKWYRLERDLDAIGLRYAMVYGPGRVRGRGSFLTGYIRDALFKKRVSIPYAEQNYNWQYVKDAARAARCALYATEDRQHDVYNVGGDFRSAREFAEILKEQCPETLCELTPGYNPVYKNTVMNMDGSVIASELGFTPVYDLESGVRDTLIEYGRMSR